jgi:hypothetical protein
MCPLNTSSIRARHLLFQSEYLEIVIPSSKTDCYRKGNSVFIARTNSEYCAVAILELNSSYLKTPVYGKEHKGNKRKSVSDLGKLKLLNNDLITSASTGVFISIGLRVFIARTNSEYCAVAILDSYLKAADIDLKSDMIIFRSVTNFKTSAVVPPARKL